MVRSRHSSPYQRLLLALCMLAGLAACGGGGYTSQQSQQVQITPASSAVTLAVNQTQALTATVTNARNTGVAWSVQESGGGTITSSGLYTAPNRAGTYHVIATSLADATRTATIVVTVTAPAPVFTSNAPAGANQGDLYQYNLKAADSAGGTVSFALLSGPAGAAINGSLLTWTPAANQSRISNTFLVRATTSEGGQAEQTWTIAPTGVVHGVVQQMNVWANGSSTTPLDLTDSSFTVLVSDSSGNTQQLEADTSADGTFTVEGVPAGFYLLFASIDAGGQQGIVAPPQSFNAVWTNRSQVDLSYTVPGRFNPASSNGGSRHLVFTNLDEWKEDDNFLWDIPNTGESYAACCLLPEAERLDTTFGTSLLADAGSGDSGFGNQFRYFNAGGIGFFSILKSTGAMAVTDSASALTNLSAALATPAKLSLHPKFSLSSFASQASTVHTGATVDSYWFDAYMHLSSPSQGFVSRGPQLVYFDDDLSQNAATDLDMGDLSVGNPFPSSWTPVYEFTQQIGVPITAPGAAQGTTYEVYPFQLTDAAPTSDRAVQPALGSITKATIGGKNLMADQSGIALTPTITWEPPALGTANGYLLQFMKVIADHGSTQLSQAGPSVLTTATSFTVPSGWLETGSSYVLIVTALSETGKDLSATPMLAGFPRAQSVTVSGVFTTGQ